MVVLAAIFIATPVLAASSSHPMEVANPSPKKQPTIISMTATILTDKVASDNTGTFEVAIKMTNRAFIKYRGEVEWVTITRNTKCLEWIKPNKSKTIPCASLKEDDRVSINAKVDPVTKVFTARRVTIYQPRTP
jgi:hypothetical protein